MKDDTYFQTFEKIVQTPKEVWIKDLYDKIWGASTNIIKKEVTTPTKLKLIKNENNLSDQETIS